MPDIERKILGLTDAVTTDDGAGSFMGYASRFGERDSVGDIVIRGAYTDTLPQFIQRGFIAWGHDWTIPVATIREASEDDQGLLLTADFHSDDVSQRARQITTERMARGKFMGLSIGYTTEAAEDTEAGRLLKRVTLYETSLVTVPALASAGVTSAKAVDEAKPFPSEHACRLRDPGDFQANSFRRTTRTHDGKEYSVIMGKLKGDDAMSEQAYRYPKDAWTADAARSHCKGHDGMMFEPASGKADCGCADAAPLVTLDTLATDATLLVAEYKAGQPQLSTTRRERLAALRASLHDLGVELDALLDETTPRDRSDGKQLWAAWQRAEFDRACARVRAAAR